MHLNIFLTSPLIYLLLLSSVAAQDIRFMETGAATFALGGVQSLSTDVSSIMGNQAGLAHLSSLSVSLNAERRFSSQALQFYSLAIGIPTSFGNAGIAIQRYGDGNFNQQSFGLVYARRIIENMSLGARFDYLQMRIPQYGKRGIATAELGLQGEITSEVLVGFHIYNPFQVSLLEGETLPTIVHLGVRYEASDKVQVFGELEKIADARESFGFGIQYEFLDRFMARVGYATGPQTVTFGLGYAMEDRYRLDISSSVHSYLGISSAGSVIFQK